MRGVTSLEDMDFETACWDSGEVYVALGYSGREREGRKR